MKPTKQLNKAILFLTIMFSASSPATAVTFHYEELPAVSVLQLDSMRGGFVTKGGWEISLGIEKVVMIDGVLQTLNTLHIPDLTKLQNLGNVIKTSIKTSPLTTSTTPAAVPVSKPNTAVPIPNSGLTESTTGGLQSENTSLGNNTTVPAQQTVPVLVPTSELQPVAITQIYNNGFATLIQNSFDQKRIQEMTVISADIYNGNMYRQVELMSRINDQLIHALH